MEMNLNSLLLRLVGRGKIHHVALLDDHGKVLAHSKSCDLSDRDIKTLMHCLTYGMSSHGMAKLSIMGTIFTCMPYGTCDRPSGVLVGRADDTMFMAIKTNCFVIVGFSDVSTPGSCIYEISEMGRLLDLTE